MIDIQLPLEAIDPKHQEILDDFQLLKSIWLVRDKHDPFSKRWLRVDKKASQKQERINKKLVKYGLYWPLWAVDLHFEMLRTHI